MSFRSLHHGDSPFILCNVWDVASARLAENLGFQALGTSSAAIASALGYPDGGFTPFDKLLDLVSRIREHTSLPLSVDIESGYSQKPLQVADHIRSLFDLGVVGVNIEDSLVKTQRSLVDAAEFSDFLSKIKNQLEVQNVDVFLNVRTDTFLLDLANANAETAERVNRYRDAGADGLFVPCMVSKSDIRDITTASSLPINVMCMPTLPGFKELKMLGVKRISMGNFLYERTIKHLENDLKSIISQENFGVVFKAC